MLLAHTREHLLAGLGIVGIANGRVFFHQAQKPCGNLFLLTLFRDLDRHGKAGFGEIDAF